MPRTRPEKAGRLKVKPGVACATEDAEGDVGLPESFAAHICRTVRRAMENEGSIMNAEL